MHRYFDGNNCIYFIGLNNAFSFRLNRLSCLIFRRTPMVTGRYYYGIYLLSCWNWRNVDIVTKTTHFYQHSCELWRYQRGFAYSNKKGLVRPGESKKVPGNYKKSHLPLLIENGRMITLAIKAAKNPTARIDVMAATNINFFSKEVRLLQNDGLQ